MNATLLRIYVHENRKQDHILVYEWLLERGHALGIPGGSATRALAGFGRTGVMRADRFYELAGDMPVVVEFVAPDALIDALLALVRDSGVRTFHVRMPVDCGVTEGKL
jgi:PII-like signaling protein